MDSLEQLISLAKQDFLGATDPVSLENAKAKYLGKTGLITAQMKMLGKMEPDQRKTQGAMINAAKTQIEGALNARRQELANEKLQARLNAEAIDVTLPGRGRRRGGIHPVMRTWERIERIFGSIGFDVTFHVIWIRCDKNAITNANITNGAIVIAIYCTVSSTICHARTCVNPSPVSFAISRQK